MSTKQKYAVIANLENQEPLHKLANLPLHVTLIGIFSTDKSQDYLKSVLKEVAKECCSVTTKIVSRSNFGDEKNKIMVTELEKNKDLAHLHQKLITSFEDEIENMDKNFQPNVYRPHVTDQNNRSVLSDKPVVINNLTLVEIQGDNILERYRIDLA